jgi:hypothetical protein
MPAGRLVSLASGHVKRNARPPNLIVPQTRWAGNMRMFRNGVQGRINYRTWGVKNFEGAKPGFAVTKE